VVDLLEVYYQHLLFLKDWLDHHQLRHQLHQLKYLLDHLNDYLQLHQLK
jgi:hypothetical protein